MTLKQKMANKEVLIILDKLNLMDKIPKDLLDAMKNNQDESWSFTYNDNLKLEEQKITRQTIILFTSLYFMYICEDNTEKEKLKKIYIENEKRHNEETMNKLNNLNERPNSFELSEKPKNKNTETQMIYVKNENFIQKIIRKIKKIFKK